MNAVGTWDELFFICTCFVLLRRHFPLWQANLLQAVIFVSFLWELGYRAWGPLLTIPFALLQGWLFAKTRSLGYVLTVHLLFDAMVFLVDRARAQPGLDPDLHLLTPAFAAQTSGTTSATRPCRAASRARPDAAGGPRGSARSTDLAHELGVEPVRIARVVATERRRAGSRRARAGRTGPAAALSSRVGEPRPTRPT